MNFFSYLHRQKQEDRQAFIIYFPASSGKTQFALRACEIDPGIFYLDLLSYFLSKPAINVNDYDLEKYKKLLLHTIVFPPGTHTILVDNGDFLFNTWKDPVKRSFIDWLRNPLRTPAVTDKTHIFMIQTDGVLSAAELKNTLGEPRVLAINQFDAI